MSKILITGGAGFIGSNAARKYSENHNVTVLDNFSRGTAKHNKNNLRKRENITVVEADVKDKNIVEDHCEGKDLILHLAGQVAVTTSLKNSRKDFEANARGTFNVLEGARKSKKTPTIIYCSTNKVYGDNVNEIPVREKSRRYAYKEEKYAEGISEAFPIDRCKHTPYGSSKLAGDIYMQDYAKLYDLRAGVFRMSCIYGKSQIGTEDQGWLSHFILSTLRDEPLTIYGDGKQVRDVLYVSDLLKAFDAFWKKSEKLNGQVFNIGGGKSNSLSLLELIDILQKKTGKRSELKFEDWRPSDQKVYITNTTKAQKELNWEPTISPEKGTERIINWAREKSIV